MFRAFLEMGLSRLVRDRGCLGVGGVDGGGLLGGGDGAFGLFMAEYVVLNGCTR